MSDDEEAIKEIVDSTNNVLYAFLQSDKFYENMAKHIVKMVTALEKEGLSRPEALNVASATAKLGK